MQRKASAVWQGGLKDGKGSISTDSGVLKQTQYSFSTRFENGVGTLVTLGQQADGCPGRIVYNSNHRLACTVCRY